MHCGFDRFDQHRIGCFFVYVDSIGARIVDELGLFHGFKRRFFSLIFIFGGALRTCCRNLYDFELGKRLPVTLLFAINLLRYVLVNDDLFRFAVLDDPGVYARTVDIWISDNGTGFALQHHHLIESDAVSFCDGQFFNPNHVAFRNAELLSACFYDCIHTAFPSSYRLARIGWPKRFKPMQSGNIGNIS